MSIFSFSTQFIVPPSPNDSSKAAADSSLCGPFVLNEEEIIILSLLAHVDSEKFKSATWSNKAPTKSN